jgi:hypothetical protein
MSHLCVCVCASNNNSFSFFFPCKTWFRTFKEGHKPDYKFPKLKTPIAKREEVKRKRIGCIRSNEELGDL